MRYYRKVIKIKAEDSPNVRLGMAQVAAGVQPTGEMLVPGVLSYADYTKRRATWDEVKQCIGLDAEFWEGADVLMFPPEWLNAAERLPAPTDAQYLGVDSAMGGDNSCWAAVGRGGLVELVSKKTRDTNEIPSVTRHLMKKHRIPAENVLFDSGGGGQQHVDRMRADGLNVEAVAFGESVSPKPKRGMTLFDERIEQREERYVFRNRRAQMYWQTRLLIEPDENGGSSFALPGAIINRSRSDGGPGLRRQLSVIPVWTDEEGRIYLPPKARRSDMGTKKTDKVYLNDMLGCSPDEADALVLAVHGMVRRKTRRTVGVAF